MTTETNDLWQEKYRPKLLSEYLDYQKYADRVSSWLRPIRDSGRTPRPFLVLYGEPGVGKTTLAHCIFAEYDYAVIECNTSESRSKDELHKILQTGKYVFEYTEKGLIKKPVGIIMDELDGIYGNELDGISEIINNTFIDQVDKKVKGYKDLDYQVRYPVILTSNSLKGDKYKAILDHAVSIKVSLPTIDSLTNLGARICQAEDIPLSRVKIRQLASLNSAMDYRVLISNLYRIKLDIGRLVCGDLRAVANSAPLQAVANSGHLPDYPPPEQIQKQVHASLERIIIETRINTQLANFINLPVFNMIGTIITHIPEHQIMLYARDLEGKQLPEEFADFKLIYDQRLQHAIDSDIVVYYNDLLDNIPIIMCAIGHELLKASAAEKRPTRPILLNLLKIMSRIAECYRKLMKYEDLMNGERDSEQKQRLFGYITYNLYAITILLNQLNLHPKKPEVIVRDMPVEYHYNYNLFKQNSSLISNNIMFAVTDIRSETSTQPFYNYTSSLINQDPELLYITANSPKLPASLSNLAQIANEKQYQSAIKKINERATGIPAK